MRKDGAVVASQSRVSRVSQHQGNISCILSINTLSSSFSNPKEDLTVTCLSDLVLKSCAERNVILHHQSRSQPSSTFVGLTRSMSSKVNACCFFDNTEPIVKIARNDCGVSLAALILFAFVHLFGVNVRVPRVGKRYAFMKEMSVEVPRTEL